MTAMIVDSLDRIPMASNLAATLKRAAEYATTQAHVEVTLEHLLLALIEDPEAGLVLATSNLDVARLSADVSDHVGRIEERFGPSDPQDVRVSADLRRILSAAAAAAQQGKRKEINGAIVLAAIVGDGKSAAAHMLRAQGLTFEEAIKALQRVATQAQKAPPAAIPQSAPQEPAGAPLTTEEVLASARERVQSRAGQASARDAQAPAGELPVAQAGEPALPYPEGEPAPPAPRQQQTAPPRSEPIVPTPLREPALDTPSDHYTGPPQPAAPAPKAQPAVARPAPPPPAHAPSRPPDAGPMLPGGPPPQHWTPPPAPFGAPIGVPPPAGQHNRMPPPGFPPLAPPGQRPPLPQMAPHQGPQPGPGRYAPPPIPPPGPQGHRGGHPGMSPPWPDAREALGRPQGPANAAQPDRGRRAGTQVETGQLVENIPRVMRVGRPSVVEVRIARAEVKAIADGLQGGGAAYHHDVVVTKAMSVRLRAPMGGFFIETASPETQWIENNLGLMTDDFASWRWTVTPRERGKRPLQVIVSARTVGADGLAAETALPDQVIEVRVRTNYGLVARRWAGWAIAAAAGGLVAKFGEERLAEMLQRLMQVIAG